MQNADYCKFFLLFIKMSGKTYYQRNRCDIK